MTDSLPIPKSLVRLIHSSCKGDCYTTRCTCKNTELFCTIVFSQGHGANYLDISLDNYDPNIQCG